MGEKIGGYGKIHGDPGNRLYISKFIREHKDFPFESGEQVVILIDPENEQLLIKKVNG